MNYPKNKQIIVYPIFLYFLIKNTVGHLNCWHIVDLDKKKLLIIPNAPKHIDKLTSFSLYIKKNLIPYFNFHFVHLLSSNN